MDEKSSAATSHLTISRVVDAPRERVFRAWTDPAQLARWFMLDALTTTHMESDPRPGGHWTIDLRGGDGMTIHVRRIYREIVEPARIVYHEQCEAGGNIILDGTHIVLFDDCGGKTRITISCDLNTPFDAENQQGWSGGWSEILERLGRHLASRAGATGA